MISCPIQLLHKITRLKSFCSVAQLCLTFCDSLDCHMPGFPVLHHLLEFVQTFVRWVSDAIQPIILSCLLLLLPLIFPSISVITNMKIHLQKSNLNKALWNCDRSTWNSCLDPYLHTKSPTVFFSEKKLTDYFSDDINWRTISVTRNGRFWPHLKDSQNIMNITTFLYKTVKLCLL